MQVNPKAVANFESLKCASCDFGKLHRLTDKAKTINKNYMKEK